MEEVALLEWERREALRREEAKREAEREEAKRKRKEAERKREEEAERQMFAGCGSLEWVTGEEDIISNFIRDETRESKKVAKEKEMAEAKRRRDLLKGRVAELTEDQKAEIRNDVSILYSSPHLPLHDPPQPFTLMYSPIIEHAWQTG